MRTLHRGAIAHCKGDPRLDTNHAQLIEDGALVVEDGIVLAVGEADALLARFPDAAVTTHAGILVPGFVDAHVHYPQLDMIASYGEQLLDWLERYTYPTEMRFGDPAHAADVASRFVTELLRNGTTTALVFCTVHPGSADALFTVAEQHDLCLIAGKVLMDRNAPDALLDSPERAYTESSALIERWHGRGRLRYAVTPRFAVTSSPEQLDVASKLLREHEGLYLHTHLSENPKEVAWVRELFPERAGYLDVYDHHGLCGPRSVFAHGVHLTDAERATLADKGAAIAFCPTSNLFLGSGLFDLAAAEASQVRVALGTDVGAGTSLSQLRTAGAAYQVLQLQGQRLDPLRALYLATLGGARALYLDHRIGSFAPGKDADFIVLDPAATPLLAHRTRGTSVEEQLFALFMLGDDRAVKQTFIRGRAVTVPAVSSRVADLRS